MSNYIPFHRPDIGDEEIASVVECLHSGWLTTGPKTKQFERDFAGFLGQDVEAIAVNSCTSGLHLALESVGVGQNDEVITTPYTFTATAEVIRYLGAHPVFVDIDPDTLNIDPHKIEKAITDRTKAIVPVHIAGLSCDMDPILKIGRQYRLKVIEDAAHALPAVYRDELVGALCSDATVYSFYVTKTITTGEGGMLVTRDEDIARRCRMMRLHGISKDVFDRYHSKKPNWYYEVIAPGFKYNMTDLAASIGIEQLKKAWAFQKRRAEIADLYNAEFYQLPVLCPPQALPGDLHAWHLYILRLGDDAPIRRNQFIEKMSELEIGCSVHFIPLHIQPYWRERYGHCPEDFPGALDAYERAVSLPLFPGMTVSEQNRVVSAVKSLLS